jgi:hypothetical protein
MAPNTMAGNNPRKCLSQVIHPHAIHEGDLTNATTRASTEGHVPEGVGHVRRHAGISWETVGVEGVRVLPVVLIPRHDMRIKLVIDEKLYSYRPPNY